MSAKHILIATGVSLVVGTIVLIVAMEYSDAVKRQVRSAKESLLSSPAFAPVVAPVARAVHAVVAPVAAAVHDLAPHAADYDEAAYQRDLAANNALYATGST